jgi:hypothetical protein
MAILESPWYLLYDMNILKNLLGVITMEKGLFSEEPKSNRPAISIDTSYAVDNAPKSMYLSARSGDLLNSACWPLPLPYLAVKMRASAP